MGRVLYIGIDYYAYTPEIRAALARQGFESDYRPIERVGFWSKTFKKFTPAAYRRRLDGYHRRLIEESAGTAYDRVLFIQCHHVSLENMARLRELHPHARFVLYNWDSLTTHDYRPWLSFFDAAWTFDPADAKMLGIGYLPLFAIPRYFAARQTDAPEIDIYFVGAIGTLQRFEALERLKSYCDAQGIKSRFHLKCSPAVRLQLLRLGKSLPGLTLRSLDQAGIVDLIERSRATFDFANHRQTGYTMRFIENMCAGRKIVTENARIKGEDFYREDRFLVIEDFDFSGLRAFLDLPVTSELKVHQWSIDQWARILVAS